MRILVAEDNPVFQAMLQSMLAKWGYDVVVARDGDEAWAHLHSDSPPRLAILDWMMPGADGVEICRRIRQANREPYTYIILLTARTQSQDLIEGMEAGADDYLTKPFNAHELRVRLRAGTRILDLQEELVLAREALREQATRDGLTGIWNRATIFDLLHKELGRATREHTPISVLMVDLDHFKRVNDRYGHLAGDQVLREAARRMKSAIRCYDAMGRYGGEEFLIILPGCDLATGCSQAERLREIVATEKFQLSDAALTVTCSIGVSCTDDPSLAQIDKLVQDADLALYTAKKQGRNRIEANNNLAAIA